MKKPDMRILIIIFSLLLTFYQPVCAADPAELFSQAGRKYEEKDFAGALEIYRQITGQGMENGKIYYNMGNAYFKSGELGKAILAYEQALKYLPRDEDIKTNLEFARLISVEKEDTEKRLNFSVLIQRFLKYFSVNEWISGFEAVYAILFLSAIILIFSRQERIRQISTKALIVMLPVWFVLGTFTGIRIYGVVYRKEAVVIEKNIKVHSGPADSYTLLFNVPEGTKILIHQRRGEWLQVTLPNGYSGWVENRSVGVI